VHDLLRQDFPGVNHKRVYRLYREANLAVRKRKKSKRPLNERVPLQLAKAVNEVWSMDFVSDSLSNGRRLKYLTVADDFSHECVDRSGSAKLNRPDKCIIGVFRHGKGAGAGGHHEQIIWAANPPRV
jgi:transposase InsO family protein